MDLPIKSADCQSVYIKLENVKLSNRKMKDIDTRTYKPLHKSGLPIYWAGILKYWTLALVFFLFLSCCIQDANAQSITWTKTDIGNTGATGTYSESAGTHTVGGAGSSISSTSDSFTFVSTPAAGNIEMFARVASQSNTTPYSVAGIMIRNSLNADSAHALVGVSPQNGVNFTSRSSTGGTSSRTLGATIDSPVYLRMVKSGNDFAGYQSVDGINWTLVGKVNIPSISNTFYVGFAVCSYSYGNLSTASFDNVSILNTVPQRSPNLKLWLRSDVNLSTDSNNFYWQDQSGMGNTATQSTTNDQPSLVTSAVNGKPALSFDGSTDFMFIPGGFSDFTKGASIFVVGKTTAFPPVGLTILDFSKGLYYDDNVTLLGSSPNTLSLTVYNGSTISTVSSTSGLTLNQYQLYEAIHDGNASASIYTDGVFGAKGAIENINNVDRSTNAIGRYGPGTFIFQGEIAEVLVFDKGLSDSERVSIEAYIYNKYAIGSQPTATPPVIVPGDSVFSSGPQTVSISADPTASIYYTTDGSAPTTSSTLYSGEFSVSATTTVKAIAEQQYFNTSPVATALVEIESLTSNVSRDGLLLWLKSDNGITKSGSNISGWSDVSGNRNDLTQSESSNKPTFVSSAINSLPAVSFDGSNDFLNIPDGFSDFSKGASIFVVSKPTAFPNANPTILDLGNGTSSDNIILSTASPNSLSFDVNDGSTASSLSSSSGLTLNQYQVFEAFQEGEDTASILTDGVLGSRGAIFDINILQRVNNRLGDTSSGGSNFQGEIAEVLIYDRKLSKSEQWFVESYLNHKYGLSVTAPFISPSSGVYDSNSLSVSISADNGANIYYTTDGSTPTTGSTVYTAPFDINSSTVVKAIADKSSVTSSVSSSYLNFDFNASTVARDNLQVWLKGDFGVVTNGSSVTNWIDLSGSGNNAVQTNSSDQPTFKTDAINSLPALSFDGSSDFLQLPPGFNNFTKGVSMFVVSNATAIPVVDVIFLDFGKGLYYNDTLTFSGSYFDALGLTLYNGSTYSNVTSSSGFTLNQFKLYEAMQDGSSNASLFANGLVQAEGAFDNINNVTRSTNVIGKYGAGTNLLQGDIAEVLVYNSKLTDSERISVESYLIQKYQLSNTAVLAPTLSIETGTLQEPARVAITANKDATIYYTTDGTTPTTSSAVYTEPVSVIYSLTLQAIAVVNGQSSSVSSATYTLDTTKWPKPDAFDTTPLHLNLQLPTTATPQ